MSGPGAAYRPDQAAIAQVFRREFGQVVATLVRVFGDIDIAEDAVQEAFAVAAEKWPESGMPPNPGGWITTTARRRAIDRLRREATRDQRHAQAALLHAEPEGAEVQTTLHDDRLRLIFTCCHPALAAPAQIALTLRLLAGCRPTRSPGRSWYPRRPSPSGWCGPSARSARPTSPTASPRTASCPTGSAASWPCCT